MAGQKSQWLSRVVKLLYVSGIPTAAYRPHSSATKVWDAADGSGGNAILTGINTNHTCVRADPSKVASYSEVTIQLTVQMDWIPMDYSAGTQQQWYTTDSWTTGALGLNFGGGYTLPNGRRGIMRFCVGYNEPNWPIFQYRFQEGERFHVWIYYNSNEKYAEMKVNGGDGNPDIIHWTVAHPILFTSAMVGCWGSSSNRLLQGAIENFTVTAGLATSSYVGAASAVGDPHLMNIHGERFDLMQPGKHVLLNLPRGISAANAMLRVQADARQLGGHCADMYFEHVNVTGMWAEARQAGGYHYSASQRDVVKPDWITFGKVDLKVVHGRTDSGVSYLNVYVKHLGQAGFAVGGLLGEDDHAEANTPPEACVKRVSLEKGAQSIFPRLSAAPIAVASLT